MTILFWTILSLVVYCYFLYPCLVFALARLLKNPVHKSSYEPTVSLLISVYNEEDVIGPKIQNLLKLDYPENKLEILIGSDGSSDLTHEIIRPYLSPRVKLFVNPKRQGKMATLNSLVEHAGHEIIFFNDARQNIDPGALKQLTANFADPKIGCVSGELVFAPKQGSTAQGVSLYWTYEKFIRRQESALHSMLGSTGAIYAIRKNLFVPGPLDIVLDDMYIPLAIIRQGFRAVFDGSALAFDEVAASPKEEYRRKTRTLFGNYQIFFLFPDMFIPLKSPIAWPLISHKFLRVMVPFCLIALFLINLVLIYDAVFRFFFVLQSAFYLAALIGHLTREGRQGLLKYISKVCYVPYVFCLLNFSALAGFWRFVTAQQQAAWTKARHP